MTKILTEESIKHAYTRKKESCAKRLIDFDLSYEYYRALMKSRSGMVCFYSQKPFDMRNTGGDNYPSLERISSSEGYTPENTVLCSVRCNRLKAKYVENGHSMKGLSDSDIGMIQRIRKMDDSSLPKEEGMKIYQEIFDKVQERKQEVEQKAKKAAQKVVKQTEEEKQAKIAQKFKEQQHFAKYYHQKAEEFSKLGVVMQISIKEMRDILRITKDAITKEPFDSIWDKHLWVVDKTKPITRSNVKIVKLSTQESLDHLSKGGSMILKTAMKNLNKIL
ncbi:putative anti-sigma factor [Vibrio phage 424E50-1]|nr:putative anti-sigma factor [Vibrio phage 424E50-1]